MGKFFYTPDAISPGAAWAETDLGSDAYTLIRPTSTPGSLYILGGTTGNVSDSWLNGDGRGTWTEIDFGDICGGTFGTYNAGADRFEATYCGPANGKVQLVEFVFDAPTTVVDIEIDVAWEATLVTGSSFFAGFINFDGVTKASSAQGSPSTSTITVSYAVSTDNVNAIQIGSSAFTNSGDGYSYITAIRMTYVGIDQVRTRYSVDYGATFAAAEIAGTAPLLYSGFDTAKIGDAVLVGVEGEVVIANAGGTYASYATMPANAQPSCIWIPRYRPGTASTANNGTTPYFVVASNSISDDDETLWIVDDSGVFTSITPEIGGIQGTAVSPNSIALPWFSGLKMSGLFSFAGDVHWLTSVNGGSTWSDRGTVASAAAYIRYRRGDQQMQQLYIANGDELTVSSAHGSNEIDKSIASAAMTGVEAF